MPWHVYFPGGTLVSLKHIPEGDGELWGGSVEIWRGSPSATDHPEIQHAFMRLQNLALHKDFIRHRWSWEIPDRWQDAPNFGESRRYMVLTATGGMVNWTLVLRFPPRTPQFVYAAVAAAFEATSKHAEPAPERLSAKKKPATRRRKKKPARRKEPHEAHPGQHPEARLAAEG
jgi:hypothetical protein